MGLTKIAHYTEHLSPAALAGKKMWPWYGSEYINSSTPLLDPGAEWDLVGDIGVGGGNSFAYVKTNAGLSAGQLVALATPAASTVAAGTTKKAVVWAAGSLTAGAEVGNLLYVANSTSSGGGFTVRKILANTTTTLTVSLTDPNVASKPDDQNAFEEIPTTGDVAIIIRPNVVQVCTASLVPVGVALGTVTQNYYTIIQTKGYAQILGVGSGTALAVGIPAVPSAAGVMIGGNSTASAFIGGNIIPMAAYSSTSALQPALINLKGLM